MYMAINNKTKKKVNLYVRCKTFTLIFKYLYRDGPFLLNTKQ